MYNILDIFIYCYILLLFRRKYRTYIENFVNGLLFKDMFDKSQLPELDIQVCFIILLWNLCQIQCIIPSLLRYMYLVSDCKLIPMRLRTRCKYKIYLYELQKQAEQRAFGQLFRPVSQRVQRNSIFNDNVRILCLSCNFKKSENLSDLNKKDRNKRHSSPVINVVKGVFFVVRVTLVPVSYLSVPSAVHSYRVPGKFIHRLKSLFVQYE